MFRCVNPIEYSIGLKCFLNCLSVFHLVFYLLQSNTRYFGSLNEYLSAFVDRELQPLVANTTSYIKGTTDFLIKLCRFNNSPDNTILVTLDVTALYYPVFLILTALFLANNI